MCSVIFCKSPSAIGSFNTDIFFKSYLLHTHTHTHTQHNTPNYLLLHSSIYTVNIQQVATILCVVLHSFATLLHGKSSFVSYVLEIIMYT